MHNEAFKVRGRAAYVDPVSGSRCNADVSLSRNTFGSQTAEL